MNIIGAWLVCLAAVAAFMACVFVIARQNRRYDIVDAAWGWAFIVAAVTSFVVGNQTIAWGTPQLVTFLVIVWGVRLSWHIAGRISRTKQEDPRYIELRKSWRGNLERNIFFRIYLLQALLATVVALPVVIINLSEAAPIGWLVWLSAAVWLIGLTVEAIADRQLKQFIGDSANKGKIMNGGLWRFSRHPNYFGELTQWWAIGAMALSVPIGWAGLIGPLLISYLIIFVSGIPPSEKRFNGRPGWDDYKRRTSVLIPLPSRSI